MIIRTCVLLAKILKFGKCFVWLLMKCHEHHNRCKQFFSADITLSFLCNSVTAFNLAGINVKHVNQCLSPGTLMHFLLLLDKKVKAARGRFAQRMNSGINMKFDVWKDLSLSIAAYGSNQVN